MKTEGDSLHILLSFKRQRGYDTCSYDNYNITVYQFIFGRKKNLCIYLFNRPVLQSTN